MIHRTDKGDRDRKGNPFTRIDNRLIDDTRLTPLARLAVVYLLSKPDDWQVRDADLRRYLEVGTHKLEGIIQELKQTGYLTRRQFIKNGRWTTGETDIFEVPKLNTVLQLRENGKRRPVVGEQKLENIPTIHPTMDEPTNKFSNEPGAPGEPDIFISSLEKQAIKSTLANWGFEPRHIKPVIEIFSRYKQASANPDSAIWTMIYALEETRLDVKNPPAYVKAVLDEIAADGGVHPHAQSKTHGLNSQAYLNWRNRVDNGDLQHYVDEILEANELNQEYELEYSNG